MGSWAVHEVSGSLVLTTGRKGYEDWHFVLVVSHPDSKCRISHLKPATLRSFYGVIPSPIIAELKIAKDRVVSWTEGVIYIHALANKFNQIEHLYNMHKR